MCRSRQQYPTSPHYSGRLHMSSGAAQWSPFRLVPLSEDAVIRPAKLRKGGPEPTSFMSRIPSKGIPPITTCQRPAGWVNPVSVSPRPPAPGVERGVRSADTPHVAVNTSRTGATTGMGGPIPEPPYENTIIPCLNGAQLGAACLDCHAGRSNGKKRPNGRRHSTS